MKKKVNYCYTEDAKKQEGTPSTTPLDESNWGSITWERLFNKVLDECSPEYSIVGLHGSCSVIGRIKDKEEAKEFIRTLMSVFNITDLETDGTDSPDYTEDDEIEKDFIADLLILTEDENVCALNVVQEIVEYYNGSMDYSFIGIVVLVTSKFMDGNIDLDQAVEQIFEAKNILTQYNAED